MASARTPSSVSPPHELHRLEPHLWEDQSISDDDARGNDSAFRDAHGQAGEKSISSISTNRVPPRAAEVKYEGETFVQGWPTSPRKLKRRARLNDWSTFKGLLLASLPIIFLIFGFAAVSLDWQPRSPFGNSIIEASKYGTTIFPMVFAAVASNLMQSVALWRCEKGASLGLLEQLVGSQSLAATIMKVFLLRRFNFIGIGVVLFWFLSPLGSQMTLRLLNLTETSNTIPTTVPYFRTFAADVNSLADTEIPQPRSLFTNYQPDSDSRESRNPMLSALLGASMLGAETVRKSSQDQYGNFRIPHLPNLPPDVWSEVPENIDSWASFTGLMVSDEALSRSSSNFIVDSAYISASCSDATKLPHDRDNNLLAQTIQKAGFHQHAGVSKGYSGREAAFSGPDGKSDNTILMDSNSLDDHDESVGKDMQGEDISKGSLIYLPSPVNLFYASKTRWLDDHSFIDVFKCTLTHPRIQANITCAGKHCRTTHLRPSEQTNASMPFGVLEYEIFLGFLPTSLGSSGPSITTVAIDQYMLGSPSPMTQGNKPYKRNFHDVSGDVFDTRLTTLLNTVWQASIANGNIAFGSAANFSAITNSTTRARVTEVQPEGQYTVDRWHAGLLLAISLLLLGCAVASTIIAKRTRASDVLGYVSSMTRDNAAFEGFRGGTTLDGVDRARLMGEVRVRLGDARGEEEVGFITLRNLDGEVGGYGGGLLRDRKYL